MVYFLGREVAVYFNTEQGTSERAVNITASGSGDVEVGPPSGSGELFADDLEGGSALNNYNPITDVTGVDISIGATDEDITYIGQMITGKVEIKKEMTISVTRKKKNNLWDTVFNGPILTADLETGANQSQGARWGINDTKIASGLINPKDNTDEADATDCGHGYRVSVQIGNTTATGLVMSFPNCTINSYSTSLSADGVTEETMEFGTQMSVKYGSDGANLNATLNKVSAM